MKKESELINRAIVFGIKPPWDASQLPANTLSKYLQEKSYHVTYICDDVSPFHILKWGFTPSVIKNFFKIIFYGIQIGNVTYFSSFSLFPHFSNISNVYTFLFKNFNIRFKSTKLKAALKHYYHISFCASYRNNKDFVEVQAHRKIFSIEDNPKGFGILSEELIEEVENRIKRERSIETWCTSKLLIKERYKKANYYSNGINENFKIDLKHNSNKRCVYIGAIEDWFDWDLVNNTFNQLGNDGYCLDIFGPAPKSISNKIKSDYINFKGRIGNKEVQNLLHNYSVGIIPFKKNDLIKYVNPIKYYEYLSCGLRTVASDWDELVLLDYENIYLASKHNFANKIKLANSETFQNNEKKIFEFLSKRKYEYLFKEVLKV